MKNKGISFEANLNALILVGNKIYDYCLDDAKFMPFIRNTCMYV